MTKNYSPTFLSLYLNRFYLSLSLLNQIFFFIFSKSITGNCFSDTKSAVYKRIMKEWTILEKNLPDSIYVKAYERRIDLLLAVIIGASILFLK
jgi:hypothetical protein